MSNFFYFGELDKMIKLDKGKEFSKLASNSKVHVIKNCGHMIILENAFEMREKIKGILKMKNFFISKSRRLRSTPFTSRIEKQELKIIQFIITCYCQLLFQLWKKNTYI